MRPHTDRIIICKKPGSDYEVSGFFLILGTTANIVATNKIDNNRGSSLIGEELLMASFFLWALLHYGWLL